ncbi:MAG: PD-(D/E)XK nuclease family protein, partial [Opitutaceae bacterium]|nr:PD-(D/E)XK nuclease family protein [Opitutaceae bacterium]
RRCEAAGRNFHLEPGESWRALAELARREARPLPLRVACAALASFLPAKLPAAEAPGRGRFAPVTLTTRRRAAGVGWSHLVFVESNAGCWPARTEPSCWLPDEARRGLQAAARFSLGVYTSEDRARLERQGYAALARDTRCEVVFSAALFDEEEPELRLAPNAWLERVLIAQGHGAALEDVFAGLARTAPAEAGSAPAAWLDIWRRRRDPAAPFDDHFLGGPVEVTRPARLAARQVERGVRDPAELWFEGVLGLRRVGWLPLTRARKKALGQLAHRMLAGALRGSPLAGPFAAKPDRATARARLEEALAALRAGWPDDRFRDSLHGELSELCRVLLDKVMDLDTGPVVAVEASLPAGATVPLGPGAELAVSGRMDLVFLDRPGWPGARVDIVDFKTGADPGLSVARMARGASLQLGVYLAAAASLGIADGRVWMLKPETGAGTSLALADLPAALAALARLRRHLETGCYGALTPDRTEYAHGFEWPLACTPVRHAVLAQKFAVTFGQGAPEEVGEEAAHE